MARRALVVGAGGMGKAWARNLLASDGAIQVGWVDAVGGVAEAAARELELDIFTGTNLDEAFERSQPDFVVNVTTPEAHRDIAVAALDHGLPVIGEKPMAATMKEARDMIAASERSGKLCMISQSRRYDSGLVAYKKLISERIGTVGILDVDFYIGAHFGGFRDEMASPLVLDMAIHTFDEARFLTGESPVAVYAEEFNPGWSWYKGDACAFAAFEMSNGLRFNYRGSWCAEGMSTSWDGDWRAVGPHGTAMWTHNGEPVAELVRFEKDERLVESHKEIPLPLATGISGSLAEFLHALDTGQTPQGECHDNIKSLAMVFAAIESSRRRERVRVEG